MSSDVNKRPPLRPLVDLTEGDAAPAAAPARRRATTDGAPPQALAQKIEIARDYLDANLHLTVSTRELAEICGLSPFYLVKKFKERVGDPPAAYHSRAKLSSAKRALEAGELTPKEAASAYGFSELSAFTRAFKSMFGVPPSQLASSLSPAWREASLRKSRAAATAAEGEPAPASRPARAGRR